VRIKTKSALDGLSKMDGFELLLLFVDLEPGIVLDILHGLWQLPVEGLR
jgi:hypothetical protein